MGGDASGSDAPSTGQPGITMLDYSYPIDVTVDGRTAVFEMLGVDDATIVFYDTITGVASDKTTLPDAATNLATGISSNLVVSAEYGNPVVSGLWSEATDWRTAPNPYATGCDVFNGGTFDISADGKTATGLLWHGCATEAFRWTDTGGPSGTTTPLEVLGTVDSGLVKSNRGSVISRDGKVIAGFAANGNADRTPAMWDADNHGTLLDPTNTENPGEVLAINADGSVLAGVMLNVAFTWTAAGGFVSLPYFTDADPAAQSFTNAMTADGQTVFGEIGDGFSLTQPTAVVWHGGQVAKLADVCAAAGIAIPDGLNLTNITGASADGKVLVGNAGNDTMFKTFVLRLP